MSRKSKKKERSWRLRKKRWNTKPSDYIKQDDGLAMVAADLTDWQWRSLPEHTKQLYRIKAKLALSIFIE